MEEIDKPLSRSPSMVGRNIQPRGFRYRDIRVPIFGSNPDLAPRPELETYNKWVKVLVLTKTECRGPMPYAGPWAHIDDLVSYSWFSWRSEDGEHWINGDVIGFSGGFVLPTHLGDQWNL